MYLYLDLDFLVSRNERNNSEKSIYLVVSVFKFVRFWYLKLRDILRDVFREFDNFKLIDIVEAKRKEC